MRAFILHEITKFMSVPPRTYRHIRPGYPAMRLWCASPDLLELSGKHVLYAILNVRNQRCLGGLPITSTRAFEKSTMFPGGCVATKRSTEQRVEQILVISSRERIEENTRSSGRNERVMERAVVALPEFHVDRHDARYAHFHRIQSGMGGYNVSLPLDIAGFE